MNILAIESAGTVASVALLQDETVTFEITTNFKKTHSETLLPMISELRDTVGFDFSKLDAIAVSEGPGSFTGLRIGAATAKGLAYTLGKPIVPVSTLAAMAYTNYGSEYLLVPIMDARRTQVYTGIYTFEDGAFSELLAPACMELQELLPLVQKESERTGKKVQFLGDGIRAYRDLIEGFSGLRKCYAPAHVREMRAGSIAVYAEKLFLLGKTETAESFLPVYLRKSQAEREREEAGLRTE